MNNVSDKKKTVSFSEIETNSSLCSEGSLSLRRAGMRLGSRHRDNDSPESGLTTPQAAAENKKEVCVTLTFHDSQLLINLENMNHLNLAERQLGILVCFYL